MPLVMMNDVIIVEKWDGSAQSLKMGYIASICTNIKMLCSARTRTFCSLLYYILILLGFFFLKKIFHNMRFQAGMWRLTVLPVLDMWQLLGTACSYMTFSKLYSNF